MGVVYDLGEDEVPVVDRKPWNLVCHESRHIINEWKGLCSGSVLFARGKLRRGAGNRERLGFDAAIPLQKRLWRLRDRSLRLAANSPSIAQVPQVHA